jgi:hypothetical protein
MQTKFVGSRLVSCLVDGLHRVGAGLFLGAIASSVVIDHAIGDADLATLAAGRRLVSLIGHQLIMPGLGLLALAGVVLALLRHGVRWPVWLIVKLALTAAIVVVANLWLLPALDAATAAAVRSAADGVRRPDYALWLARESGLGGLNVLLFGVAGGLGLARTRPPALRLAAFRRASAAWRSASAPPARDRSRIGR